MPNGPCQTRVDLLDAAEELFSSSGYDAVGIREIAKRAGTNIASINYHFGSKHELYLETVSRALTQPEPSENGDDSRQAHAWQLLEDAPPLDTALEAAALLARFIRAFLIRSLSGTGRDACGMLIIREGMQPSEALDAVVSKYIRPNQTLLVNLLRVIEPHADEKQLARDSQSILGQMIHYRVFRAIIEKLRGRDLSCPGQIEELANHVTNFSLRGLGCHGEFIDQALAAAASDDQTELLQGT